MIIDAELTVCPAFGWQGGPSFNTMTKTLRSGRERRRPLWAQPKHHYILPFQNITNDVYLNELKSIFLVAMGSAHSFFVRDSSNYLADNAVFGAGDGVETDFDLSIMATFGPVSYFRRIMFPVEPEFTVDGLPATASYNAATQKVEFAVAPGPASVLAWSGEFRILVRFVSDTFPMSIDNRSGSQYMMNGSVELMEVDDVDDES